MGGFDVAYQQSGAASQGVNDEDRITEANDPVGAVHGSKNKREDDERLLRALNAWWVEARDAHAANRVEQHIDTDFYDHHQIDAATAAAMASRGQAPLTYNLIKAAIDWVIGTERRTRIDWKLHPRGPEDQKPTQAKQAALKFIDDTNNGSFARSHAFTQAVKCGVGWLEECYNDSGDEEPLTIRCEDWKNMWWDPFARQLDLRDARYIIRAKWLDVDYACTLFPEHAAVLERNARAADDLDMEDHEDPADVPGLFFNRTSHSHERALRDSSPIGVGRRLRSRVRILETWYRKPVRIQRMASIAPDLDRKIFNPSDTGHVEALNQGLVTLVDGINDQVCMALWLPGALLARSATPYRHNRYPFTPIFAYRDDKNGMPYGMIRGMRDAQDDYNKRRAKALFLLSTNRLIYEDGVIMEGDEEEFLDEAAAPNAQLRVRAGALKDGRIKFEWGADLANSQLALMEQSKLHIFEGNGITRENLGQESNAISGRAILAKQQQGAVTTAELFDNYRFAFRVSGQKATSLIEQFMTLPKRLRIVGPKGLADWLTINEPMYDPTTGKVIFENDITAHEADFYVDQQDYRETVRMAMAESLFDALGSMAPEVQLSLLDLAIELTDLPNRDEFVRRIRAMNGQTAPGQEADPAAEAARNAQAAATAAAQQAETDALNAKTDLTRAQTTKTLQDARGSAVKTKADALQAAGLLAAAVPLAPAADRMAELPEPTPAPAVPSPAQEFSPQ